MTLEKLFESTRTWQVEGSQHAGVELNKFSRVLNLFTVQFPKCGRASFIFCGQHANMIRASVCETGKDGVQGKARFPAWGKNSFKSSFTGSDLLGGAADVSRVNCPLTKGVFLRDNFEFVPNNFN